MERVGRITIGSVCDVKTGKLDANASNENGTYPFFTCSKEPLRINTFSYDAECVLIAGNGDLNVKYYNGKFDAYQRTYIITLKTGITNISVRYLFAFFSLYVETLRRKSIGGVIKYIKLGDITEAKIPIPPLQEQERIVAELDLLTGIIDKQKQQLKELDTLAQSIFYDMFGNPVENEKGWHCMNLRGIASFKNGLNYTNKKSGRLVKVLGVSDFQNRSFVDSSEIGCVHIDDCFDDDYYLNDDDIVFVRSNGSKALIGRSVRVLTQGENITYSGYCIRCRITSPLIISPYLDAFVKTEQIHNVLTTGGRGCNIQNLNQTTLGDLIIPIPPLEIQNSFTKKIQSIESQKESLNRSIAESQKLFDYTMDKYFG